MTESQYFEVGFRKQKTGKIACHTGHLKQQFLSSILFLALIKMVYSTKALKTLFQIAQDSCKN